MKKKILIAVFSLVLIISVFANFYSPLFRKDTGFEDVNLSLNVSDPTFQPIFITKRGGVTEAINAKFHLKYATPDSVVEIDKIDFKTLRLSGLINHRIKNVTLDIDRDTLPFIVLDMRFLKGESDFTVHLDSIKYPIVREAFKFKNKKIHTIYTIADYGYDPALSRIIGELMNKKISVRDSIVASYLNTESGSICNINAVHEE